MTRNEALREPLVQTWYVCPVLLGVCHVVLSHPEPCLCSRACACALQLARLTDSTDGFAFKSKMADAQLLATASRRAGDRAGEGLAFFRLALLQDNLKKYRDAIRAYKKYLGVCERLDDQPGVALALNCIGVNLQILAAQENDAERRDRVSALSCCRSFPLCVCVWLD